MQDQDIGQYCSKCRLKDYIPYNCKLCGLVFCHEDYWHHECVLEKRAVDRQKQQTRFKEPPPEYRCSLQTCKKKLFTVNHYFCEDCGKLFCLGHRLPEDHGCRTQAEKTCQLI